MINAAREVVSGSSATQDGLGIRPTEYRLPASARLGGVVLQVADLERSLEFYRDLLGFRLLRDSGGIAALGVASGGEALIELLEVNGAAPATRRRQLGLYHLAILLPQRDTLGRLLAHLSQAGELAGAADHLVSEAIYLRDPDGLGVEVCADRPRSSWQMVGCELLVDTEPLDRDDLIGAAAGTPWVGMPAGTSIGHVHLHVGTLEDAVEFYHLGIGLDLSVWSFPGALFLSAGGYHHHLGVNTWAGAGAKPPCSDDAQLLQWEVVLPDPDDIVAVARNLVQYNFHGKWHEGGWTTTDPWGNVLHVRAEVGNERLRRF